MKPTRLQARQRRHQRVRRRVCGTQDKPRMSVCTTSKHIYVQFIDDEKGRTLASISTSDKELKGDGTKPVKSTVATAKQLGAAAAARAKAQNITEVVFDRGGFRFHGKIKAVADGAREAGLKF